VRVLLVCHRFPYPPTRGGKIRPFHVIKHLQREHEVTVASLWRSREEEESGRGLSDYCTKIVAERVRAPMAFARMAARVFTGEPSSMGYFHSPRLARRIRAELEETRYDMVFVHCSSVVQYVEHVRGIPRVLDFGDMDSEKWLSYAEVLRFPRSFQYWLEGAKLRKAEERMARAFDLCTCTTAAEVETLDSFGSGVRSAWFPNGVDSDYFCPVERPYDPDTVSFIGRMDYYPNVRCMVDFCRATLPLIRAARPATKVVIVGADPSAEVRGLERIPGVTVTGSVPDVRDHVRGSALTVAPLDIARGTQNKILESLAMGVPCVCSDLAAKGVDAVPGEHLLAASTREDFAAAVVRLLSDPAERSRFSEAGRARMLSNHSWEASMERMDGILAEHLAAARR
jgi:sugar transferase (PEP-CTERM/EpsH1 system associated)